MPFYGFSPAPKAPTAPFFGAAPSTPATPFFGPAPKQPATNPFWHTPQKISGYDPSAGNPFSPGAGLPDDGPGNYVVVTGQTRPGQYTQADLTSPLGTHLDVSEVVSLSEINDRQETTLAVDTLFKGGANQLFVYGDADFTRAEVSFIDQIRMVGDATATFSVQ